MGSPVQLTPQQKAAQVYAAIYGGQQGNSSSNGQPTLTPDLTFSNLYGNSSQQAQAPSAAPAPSAKPANSQPPLDPGTTFSSMFGGQPSSAAPAQDTPQGNQPGVISRAMQPPAAPTQQDTAYSNFFSGQTASPQPPSRIGALAPVAQQAATPAQTPNAPIEAPPTPPPQRSRGAKIARDIGLALATAMNPAAGAFAIENTLEEPRRYQEELQEYQRRQPQMQAEANQRAALAGAQTQEATARAGEAQAGAQAQTVHTSLEQTQFEQQQRLHVADQLGSLAAAYQQGNVPPAAILSIGQRIYQNDPIVQGRMSADQWNRQLQAIASGMPSQASMQVSKNGDVPASISWMGQSWNAQNISQAPQAVQMRWQAENAAHGQGITEEKAKEQREFANRMATQMEGNTLELDRMSTMFGFKNAQEAQGRYFKAQQTINDADSEFSQAQQLAQKGDSASDHFLLMKAAGGSLPEGTKRLNEQEIQNVESLGGLDQHADAELRKWGSGTVFTPETRAQLLGVMKLRHDTAVSQANADIDAAHKVFQQSIAGVPGAAGSTAAGAPPAPSATSHAFSLSAWQRANPKGDPNAAAAAAKAQGYEVTQ